jgi:hypothetical protein
VLEDQPNGGADADFIVDDEYACHRAPLCDAPVAALNAYCLAQ